MQDDVATGSLVPQGYKLTHVPRSSGRGGGVGFVFKEGISLQIQDGLSFNSFESMILNVRIVSFTFKIVIVYRIPPSS